MLRLVLATLAASLLLAAVAVAAEIGGTAGDDALAGGPTDDEIFALAGNDRIAAGAGDDSLSGGPGADDLAGGPGQDAVSYADHAAVVVTIDDLANDGGPMEQDNVQTDIEDVFGSPGPDRLEGTAGANTLDGGAGADTLIAGGGEDSVFGGEGDDRIEARDGLADSVDCGAGSDVAVVDRRDAVVDCETVESENVVAPADGTVRHYWSVYRDFTKVTELTILDPAPARATIEIRCHGGGCPYADRRVRVRARARLDVLDGRLARARLKPGARIEVWIVARGRGGKVVRFSIADKELPGRARLCVSRPTGRPTADCGATPAST